MRRHVLRQPEQKRRAVNALRGLNFQLSAAGDSYDDTGMLGATHAGFVIHPPEAIVKKFPQFPVTRSYAELKTAIDTATERLRGAATPG